MKVWKIGLAALGLLALTSTSSMAAERDPTIKRVPADQLAEVQKWTFPFEVTEAIIDEGYSLFTGDATCFTCHGFEGKGDGPAGAALDPSPRNFTNHEFYKTRTEGELMWILKNGSAGTAMVPFIGTPGALLTEEQGWKIIAFVRSLGENPN